MTTSEQLASSVRRGLRFLHDHQLPYGEFRTYASPSLDLGRTFFDSSIFVTTLVLYSIGGINGPYVRDINNKALSFLVEEMHNQGLFQYYTSRNARSIGFDLDDTACASVALQRSHPFVAQGQNLRHFIRNRNEAGLFYTWLDRATTINNVDSFVNANVVLYLGYREETESACRYLIATIKGGREWDSYQYYLDNMTLYYAVSRAFARGTSLLREAKDAVFEKVLRASQVDGSFGHELATACAVCSLANFGYENVARLEDATRYLARQQRADGSWRRIAMFHGSGVYYGSEELTTALCLEALTHVIGRSVGGN